MKQKPDKLNANKKLIVVSERFYPDSNAISIRMKYVVDSINAHKQFSTQIITATKVPRELNYNCVRTISAGSLRTNGVMLRLIRELIFGFEVGFRLLFKSYDALLLTSPPFFSGFIITLFTRLKRRPYFLDIRDYYPEVIFDLGYVKRDNLAGKILLSIERSWYRHCLKIFTVNRVIQLSIQNKINAKIEKIFLMRNGFDEKMFQSSVPKYPDFTVVFHANLAKLHNIDLVLDIISNCEKREPKIKFCIIGDGPEAYKIKEARLSNLNYIGPVAYEKIPGLIRKAHIGLSVLIDSNLTKGIVPVKVFEYIGVGIPVISAPGAEPDNILSEYTMGLSYSVLDIDGIVSGILKLRKNSKLYKQITGNIEKHRLLFSRQKIAKEYVNHIVLSLSENHSV